jgi:hypothetical protein
VSLSAAVHQALTAADDGRVPGTCVGAGLLALTLEEVQRE